VPLRAPPPAGRGGAVVLGEKRRFSSPLSSLPPSSLYPLSSLPPSLPPGRLCRPRPGRNDHPAAPPRFSILVAEIPATFRHCRTMPSLIKISFGRVPPLSWLSRVPLSLSLSLSLSLEGRAGGGGGSEDRFFGERRLIPRAFLLFLRGSVAVID